MVLQVASDRRAVKHDIDAERAKMSGRTDPRAHQKLRRAERAGANDDFGVGMHPLRAPVTLYHHAGGASSIKDNALHLAVGSSLADSSRRGRPGSAGRSS